MARLVKRTATAPLKNRNRRRDEMGLCVRLIEQAAVCDGSHKALKTAEEDAALCWYDAEGKRHSCAEALPDVRSW